MNNSAKKSQAKQTTQTPLSKSGNASTVPQSAYQKKRNTQVCFTDSDFPGLPSKPSSKSQLQPTQVVSTQPPPIQAVQTLQPKPQQINTQPPTQQQLQPQAVATLTQQSQSNQTQQAVSTQISVSQPSASQTRQAVQSQLVRQPNPAALATPSQTTQQASTQPQQAARTHPTQSNQVTIQQLPQTAPAKQTTAAQAQKPSLAPHVQPQAQQSNQQTPQTQPQLTQPIQAQQVIQPAQQKQTVKMPTQPSPQQPTQTPQQVALTQPSQQQAVQMSQKPNVLQSQSLPLTSAAATAISTAPTSTTFAPTSTLAVTNTSAHNTKPVLIHPPTQFKPSKPWTSQPTPVPKPTLSVVSKPPSHSFAILDDEEVKSTPAASTQPRPNRGGRGRGGGYHSNVPREAESERGSFRGRGGYHGGRGGAEQLKPRSALDCREQICMLFARGECFMADKDSQFCSRGRHVKQDLDNLPVPTEAKVCSRVTTSKMKLIQQKWNDAGGPGLLLGVWQIKNPRLAFMYQATEHNFMSTHRQASESIDAWHGSGECNIFSLAINGFDTSRRSGQVYGEGEYFAKNPTISIGYCRGGSYMLLCKLLLGKPEVDHHWQEDMGYYIIKHREGQVQALPLYVVRFVTRDDPHSELTKKFASLQVDEAKVVSSILAAKQRGADSASIGRPEAGMSAATTNQLWLGWLNPALTLMDDEEVKKDVCAFLEPIQALEVKTERNGARVGAHVRLTTPITLQTYQDLCHKPYQGKHQISVDDSQKNNPLAAAKECPRLNGPTKYCRGWNLAGHHEWHKACSFQHPQLNRPTHNATYRLEPAVSAKVDDITTNFMRDGMFHNGTPRITRIQRVVNPSLEVLYNKRLRFLSEKHGFVVEKDLWHGTYCSALPDILTHGLQPPSDNAPSDLCPKSGGKGMSTTLCGNDCKFCVSPHVYSSCHMFGLGVYLADSAKKSNRYVHPTASKPNEFSMLYCRTLLGNPYLIEGNLLTQSAMHHRVWCSNPSDCLETVAEEWDLRGHDSYYVKGQSGRQKALLGVENSEYVLFQPFHILPLYLVEYIIR